MAGCTHARSSTWPGRAPRAPAVGEPDAYPRLVPALTRAVRWDIIAEQYDQIRSGTACAEAILRRFTKANAIHPAYQGMIEIGRAQRTIFAARYLSDRDLQREIGEGLNVVESWNRANSVISRPPASTSTPSWAIKSAGG